MNLEWGDKEPIVWAIVQEIVNSFGHNFFVLFILGKFLKL